MLLETTPYLFSLVKVFAVFCLVQEPTNCIRVDATEAIQATSYTSCMMSSVAAAATEVQWVPARILSKVECIPSGR